MTWQNYPIMDRKAIDAYESRYPDAPKALTAVSEDGIEGRISTQGAYVIPYILQQGHYTFDLSELQFSS